MSENRYANVFRKEDFLYVFPWGFVDNRLFTVDTCMAKLPADTAPQELAKLVMEALQAFGRDISVTEFQTRKDPLLSAMGQKSQAQMNKGLGQVEVDDLVDEGFIDLIPHAVKGRIISPMLQQKIRLPRNAEPKQLGLVIHEVLKVSSAANR